MIHATFVDFIPKNFKSGLFHRKPDNQIGPYKGKNVEKKIYKRKPPKMCGWQIITHKRMNCKEHKSFTFQCNNNARNKSQADLNLLIFLYEKNHRLIGVLLSSPNRYVSTYRYRWYCLWSTLWKSAGQRRCAFKWSCLCWFLILCGNVIGRRSDMKRKLVDDFLQRADRLRLRKKESADRSCSRFRMVFVRLKQSFVRTIFSYLM